MTKRCLVYFRYYSWENPDVFKNSLLEWASKSGYQTAQVISDMRDSDNHNFLNFLAAISDWTDCNFVVPSLDHLDEYVTDTHYMLCLLNNFFDNNMTFESSEEALSSNERTHLFVHRLVQAIDVAKTKLKSARITQARIAAKMAGEQVGAKKVRDDEKIRELRAQGLSIRQIADELGTSTSPVVAALRSDA